MTTDTTKADADAVFTAFFGEVPADDAPAPRGVRLTILPDGSLTLARPGQTGDKVIVVQQVPHDVADDDVIRRMDRVSVLRRGSADYQGCRVIHYDEISEGAILR